MAVVLSGREAASRLSRLTMSMNELRRQRLQIDRLASDMEAEGNTALAIETAINALLVDWASLKAQIITELTAIPSIHQSRVKIGMPATYSSANIEATNTSNVGLDSAAGAIIRSNTAMEKTLTNGPFHVFLVGDVVSVSSAEDSDNDVTGLKVLRNPEQGGVNMITNGGFASTSAWTEASADIAITGGKAVFTAASAVLSQAKADMYNAGAANSSSPGWDTLVYLVEFTLDGFSAGSLSLGTNTSATQYTITYSAALDLAGALNKTHRVIVTGDGDAAGLKFTGVGLTANMDNVSMIPLSGLCLNYPLGSDNDEDKSVVITLQER